MLSRQKPPPGEWRLDPEVVQMVWERFGRADVDLFASVVLTHCPLWFFLSEPTSLLGQDALAHSWPDRLLYAFPPVPLHLLTLHRIARSSHSVLLVAPFWPGRIWFPLLHRLLNRVPWPLPLRQDLLSQFVVDTIAHAYRLEGLRIPPVKCHSTSTSWAALKVVLLNDICAAAAWASSCTFAHFYRVNVAVPHPVAAALLSVPSSSAVELTLQLIIFYVMEEIYANIEDARPVKPRPSANQTGPRSSEKPFHRAMVLCLGLLSVFLLAGLIGLGIHYRGTIHDSMAELFMTKANLTERLQASNDKLSSISEERDLLKANLTEMAKELDRLQSLSKQKTHFKGVDDTPDSNTPDSDTSDSEIVITSRSTAQFNQADTVRCSWKSRHSSTWKDSNI
ncbi:hypothetical protein D5F01_LYC24435 [Larimichthys crocea]|uniref:Uncharacterized protein n=1 Tax=Larimichthys crocea TaxID=215358 RepID=A0A6G0HEF8_LARCR|nr:hypothetical protein D5F01_LYC24435 [Larimichthys crocea]